MPRLWSILLFALPISTNAVESFKFIAGKRLNPAFSCADKIGPLPKAIAIDKLAPPFTETHDLGFVKVIDLKKVDLVVIETQPERSSALVHREPKIEISAVGERPITESLYNVEKSNGSLSFTRKGLAGFCQMDFEGQELIGALGTCSIIHISLLAGQNVKVYQDGLLLHGKPDFGDIENLLAASAPVALDHLRNAKSPVSYEALAGVLKSTPSIAVRREVTEILAPKITRMTGVQLVEMLKRFPGPDRDMIETLKLLLEKTNLQPADTIGILGLFMRADTQLEAAGLIISSKPSSNLGPLPQLFSAMIVNLTKPALARALVAKNVPYALPDLVAILEGTRSDSYALELLEILAPHLTSPTGHWSDVLSIFTSPNARVEAFKSLKGVWPRADRDDVMGFFRLLTEDRAAIRRGLEVVGDDMPELRIQHVSQILNAFEPGFALFEIVDLLRPHLFAKDEYLLNLYLLDRFAGRPKTALEHYIDGIDARRYREKMERETGLRMPQSPAAESSTAP